MTFEVDGLKWTSDEDSLIRHKYGARGKARPAFYPSGLPRLWKIAAEWAGERAGRRFAVEVYCGGRHAVTVTNENMALLHVDGPSNIAIAWAIYSLCGGDLLGKVKEIEHETNP
jgi:hypothetical protein